MQSSNCSSLPSKSRRFDLTRRTTALAGPKSRSPGFQKEEKNVSTVKMSSPRRAVKAPAAPARTRVGLQPRAPVNQSRLNSQKQAFTASKSVKPKPRSSRVSAAAQIAPAAAVPPPPSVLPLDPNCNEPSLPCLCCDGRSPQDNNSMFNHNHNNNNTISIRQQLQLPPPPPTVPLPQKRNGTEKKEQAQPPSEAQAQVESTVHTAVGLEKEDMSGDENSDVDPRKIVKAEEEDDEDESSGELDTDDDDDDDEDDDTLVPSCCDGPPSLLEFSLSSSTSSSSTSISSCSDLESDSDHQSTSLCSSHEHDELYVALSPKEDPPAHEGQPPARSPPSLPHSNNPFYLTSPCSPDEGYPSALDSPSPDYLGVKEDSEVTKLGLLDFLESVGEFGKMERFSQVIQVARWDLEGEQHWDVLRDRLDHLDRLENVNREVKLFYITRLHEKGFDIGDLEEHDLSDIMDEMGNIDISWKMYKSPKESLGDSQEFSDAGVDLTAPSDCDDPLIPDSLTPSPAEPPPRPPKPPARHASVSSYLHDYINISRETTSMAVSTSPTLSTFSPNSSSPTFTTFRCEKSLPPSPPSVPPLPSTKPVPYLTLYTTPSPPITIPTPTPPIPPPRKRHLARKEAQRLAALKAAEEKTPLSLPPPTTRPPPLPPPPILSTSVPPAIPPPPALPPPPSFHALDVEIRKLLMLAGLTQAELLKLSPELGVCVGGLDNEEDGGNPAPPRSEETRDFRQTDGEETEKGYESGFTGRDKCSNRSNEGVGLSEEDKKKDEIKDAQRTTSFTEMARRRKKNSILTSDQSYNTGLSSEFETQRNTLSFETFNYPSKMTDSPPPPPPRPLPPIPPSVPHRRVSTLPANSAQPERFDWLIAFTPDSDAPPQPPSPEMGKPHTETEKKGSSGAAPNTTTFKELRFRNKSASPPTKVITDPVPDPSVITPDPDILYNLKWRREKAGSDGNQWEYTSQAQAFFMQPPPALTSMAALKEMLKRADEKGGQPELCPSQKIDCPVSENSLWSVGREWEVEEGEKKEKEGKEEEKEEVEKRGRADGGRTIQSRTSGYDNSKNFTDPRPSSHVGREATDTHCCAPVNNDIVSAEKRSGFNDTPPADVTVGRPDDENVSTKSRHVPLRSISSAKTSDREFISDSVCHFDSLYCSDSETKSDTHAQSDPSDSGTSEAPGCSTPYKNIDVMMTHSNGAGVMDPWCSQKRAHTHSDGSSKARTFKELPPLPSLYLYHPKNCPLHRGAPPRLSPIGALSPPQRPGAPPPAAAGSSGLSSPFFPRSHTLPALAAPLYYPNLYPPIPPRAPPLPPKLYQAPPQSHVATVRSTSWMGEDVTFPMTGLGLSSLFVQKKALVSAVSVAVEAVLAQFSSSRTAVQKALSGDSTVNPSLGRLVLQCLCPALHSLLTDGLKPHQSDLISGRRPNSAWGLVQASTKPGPKTQALFNIQVRVWDLPQLRQSKHRFNAFLLGLLNAKLLDFWLSHLQTCSDVLETFYHPTSFMHLSLTTCQPLFEELLLVLQPLSLLTFNLDLLFQHHRLEADAHHPQIPSPPSQVAGLRLSAKGSQCKTTGSKHVEGLSELDFVNPGHQAAKESVSPQADEEKKKKEEEEEEVTDVAANGKSPSALSQTSPQLLWVQNKDIGPLPPPDVESDSLAQQAGQVIQLGLEAMMRLGDRLSQNLAAVKKLDMNTELPDLQTQTGSDYTSVGSVGQVPWGLGRLFGASKNPISPAGHTTPTRRPSQWLAPGVTAITRMMSSSSAPALKRAPEPQQQEPEEQSDKQPESLLMKDRPRPLRSVRTLCDYTGTGSELTFCRGEELLVLGGVDQDWIRCRQGDREGLVPIGYTSLIM